MRFRHFTFIILILFCLAETATAQYLKKRQKYLDALNACKSDTCRLRNLNILADITSKNNFIESHNYGTQALELAERFGLIKEKVEAYNHIGDAYWFHGNFIKAQDFYFKAYRINDSIKDEKAIAYSLYNIGWIICLQQKNYKEVGYLYRSLAIFQKLDDVGGISKLYNALGGYYGDRHFLFKQKPDFDSALSYYNKAIEYLKYKDVDRANYGIFYGNIGDLMSQLGDYKSAKFYAEKYLDIIKDSGDSASYFLSIANLGNYESNLGNTDKAISLFDRALRFAEANEIGNIAQLCYAGLYEAYEKKGNTAKAFEFFKKNKAIDDTLNKQLSSASLSDIKSSFEIEKKEADIKQLKQANEIQELKAKQNKFILAGVGIVLLIIMVIAYLLYKRNQEKYAANLLLKEQNAIISQKKQEIEHSIQYAKGIQNALLPSIKEIKSVFPEGFIFYQPKDVVSGDFYWFHKLGDHFYLIAADCTGHGVPGALMSIVSMDKIAQGIFEKKITEPAEILKFLNIEIKNSLKQHDGDSKQRDGLDLALVRINIKTNQVDFSSANRPIYVVSKETIAEYKADKVAIAGFTPDDHRFQQLSVSLNKGDCLYLSTDGYADQFGGPENKKFMTKNFKLLLGKVHHLDMNSQEKELINNHLTWKGNYEQVDDILVIGIKI